MTLNSVEVKKKGWVRGTGGGGEDERQKKNMTTGEKENKWCFRFQRFLLLQKENKLYFIAKKNKTNVAGVFFNVKCH